MSVAQESTPLLSSSSSPATGGTNGTKKVQASVRDAYLPIEPAQGLTGIVTGGIIKTTDGVTLIRRPCPPPLDKDVPTSPPSRTKARHKSQFLNGLNEFRHQYKNTRLALKFGGLALLAQASWDKMASFSPTSHKSLRKMGKQMKRLGQGGPMRGVLEWLHPFTNALRLSMVVLRSMECPNFYRLEVFVEEFMVSAE